jgi:hypothetical protein
LHDAIARELRIHEKPGLALRQWQATPAVLTRDRGGHCPIGDAERAVITQCGAVL